MAINKRCYGIQNGKFQYTFITLIAGILSLSGCATSATNPQIIANKADPYEHINRKIYVFNDAVDNYVAEPISNAYRYITPQFIQTGVFNFYNNLKNINVVANDVLQAKFEQSAKDTGRFAINSTVGVAGLFDVAKKIGLEQNNEDFEQTLAVWGIPRGSYLVIPLLGPTTVRGIPGAVFDTAANPASYVGAPIQLISLLNTRANAEGSLKFIDEAALDPYVFTRESFLQWRENLATDGKSQANASFDDDLDEDDLDADSASPKKSAPANNVDRKGFAAVSYSFNSIAHSFDETAKTFHQASDKLGRLKQ
jgi:phospholipid-binding lipoprotein MlaA